MKTFQIAPNANGSPLHILHTLTQPNIHPTSIKGDKRSGAISNDAINNNRIIEMQLWSIFFHSLPFQKAFARIQL